MRKNYAYVTKMAYLRQTKICMAIFALAERLQTSATLQLTIFGKLCNMNHDIEG